jgi:hypothetical protein
MCRRFTIVSLLLVCTYGQAQRITYAEPEFGYDNMENYSIIGIDIQMTSGQLACLRQVAKN